MRQRTRHIVTRVRVKVRSFVWLFLTAMLIVIGAFYVVLAGILAVSEEVEPEDYIDATPPPCVIHAAGPGGADFSPALMGRLNSSTPCRRASASICANLNLLRTCRWKARLGCLATPKQAHAAIASSYRKLRMCTGVPLRLWDLWFHTFSTNQMDGLLTYVFALAGTETKKAVDMCAGEDRTNVVMNLLVNQGFKGLIFDGNGAVPIEGERFYRELLLAGEVDVLPEYEHDVITAESVNALLFKHPDFHGQIDILALDLDGIDYWIFKAVDVISARVLVVEYNEIWGPTSAVTVPYRPDFKPLTTRIGQDYSGASLMAWVKLGRQKGYRFIGCDPAGSNAIFLRNDVGTDHFPEVWPAASGCFDIPEVKEAMDERLPTVVRKRWIEV